MVGNCCLVYRSCPSKITLALVATGYIASTQRYILKDTLHSTCRDSPELGKTDMLHLFREQAFRPVPLMSEFDCGMGILPVPKKLMENGATY